MISESKAAGIIENELAPETVMILQRKQLEELMKVYTAQMVGFAENGDIKKFETQLMVTNRLFFEAEPDVRDIIQAVVLSSLSELLERKPELFALVRKNMSWPLVKELYGEQSFRRS